MSLLFDFFDRVAREKWSGEVHVTATQGHAYLLFRNGLFIWAHRPLDRAVERFQKIEWLALPPPEVLINERSWESLVRDLLQANGDHYSRLIRLLKIDRLEIFFRIFFWSNVEILPRGFDVTLPDPVQFGFYTQKRLPPLLDEARHRLKEWPQIQDRMGNSKRVFVSAVQIPDLNERQLDAIDKALLNIDDEKDSSAAAASILKSFPYSPEEIEILRLCNGSINVQEIIRQSLEGEFLVLRRLMNLWSKGAIRPKDEDHHDGPMGSQVLTFTGRDMAAGFWSIIWVGILALALSVLEGLSPPRVFVPTSLTQAIEVFRHKHGHYPLSLVELAAEPSLESLPIEGYDYSLLQSDEYRIRTKK